ncbi:PP2C family protein-serine/threonine phosphatase [Actomonas aquatica]|uniref:Protein phosphatase 2C domain-containing protein n=1 Tax=Actomonas aquatica TaxID=2866162 RepID=A0ABZ1CFQ4_9BACT|nr:protein phosphatase 2C domain-containing protein [Opitutus sp. WL0086]WRQ89115.1 protein phosphatase 2C domain-containing protein [Opitutus sp. WL0086]
MFDSSSPTLKLQFAGATDVGLRRENNEDAWWAGSLADLAKEPLVEATGAGEFSAGLWLGVCDGLGGANAGEVASRIALTETQGTLATAPRGKVDETLAREALDKANTAVLRASRSNPEWAGMGATISFVWVEGGTAMLGQVGDSRIYRWRESWLEELSVDHSPVGRLRQAGHLSESDARRHPSRHVIDQCLGGGDPGLLPDCSRIDLVPGDVLLLCTDGLTDGVSDAEIATILAAAAEEERTLPETVAELIKQANRLSGRDNVTVIVARCVAE